jgi:hypothetical protein
MGLGGRVCGVSRLGWYPGLRSGTLGLKVLWSGGMEEWGSEGLGSVGEEGRGVVLGLGF